MAKQRRRPLFPWNPQMLDFRAEVPSTAPEAPRLRELVILRVAALDALGQRHAEKAVLVFRCYADEDLLPVWDELASVTSGSGSSGLSPKDWMRLHDLMWAPTSRGRGRPHDIAVAVRVCAVDCLCELCHLRLSEAIHAWNGHYPEHAYGDDPDASEAQFRVERQRLRRYLTPPPPPKRPRGRPRKPLELRRFPGP